MLVLRRKVGESFLLGEKITVTLLGVDPGGTVNLGIDAPRDVLILRSELQQAASANQDAANGDVSLVEALETALFHSEQHDGGSNNEHDE